MILSDRRITNSLLYWVIVTLDFPSPFDLCRDISVDKYLHDMRTLIKRQTNTDTYNLYQNHHYLYILTQLILISIIIFFAAKRPYNFLFPLLFSLYILYNVFFLKILLFLVTYFVILIMFFAFLFVWHLVSLWSNCKELVM